MSLPSINLICRIKGGSWDVTHQQDKLKTKILCCRSVNIITVGQYFCKNAFLSDDLLSRFGLLNPAHLLPDLTLGFRRALAPVKSVHEVEVGAIHFGAFRFSEAKIGSRHRKLSHERKTSRRLAAHHVTVLFRYGLVHRCRNGVLDWRMQTVSKPYQNRFP